MKRLTIVLAPLVILLAGVGPAAGQELQYVTSSMWTLACGAKVVDSYAYCAFFGGLAILDVADPHHPVEISRLYCPGNGRGVDVSGDYAYLADERSGLQIIDVSDPYHPFIAACYDTPGRACDVTVRDALAYVADGPGYGSGLVILDVSDPVAPTFLGNFSAGGQCEKCTISGDYAYIGGIYYGLDIVDISDPENPFRAAFYEMCSSIEICVRDSLAYVTAGCGGGDDRTDEYTLLYVLDVNDPTQPVTLGECEFDDWGIGPVEVTGDYAYLRGWGNDDADWIVVVDVSDPAQPVQVGAVKADGALLDLQIEGETIYAAMSTGGFQVLDIESETAPVLIGTWCEGSRPDGIAVVGGVAYVADGRAGLRVLDISNPEVPVDLARLSLPGTQRFVQAEGDLLYLVDFVDRFTILDVSDPSDPQTLAALATRVYGAHVQDSHAFLAQGSHGFFIYDISNPEVPQEVGWCDVPGHAWDVIVADGLAYISAFEEGLQIVDVSDPTQPLLRGGISFGHDYFKTLEKVGDLVYVPAGYSTLFILEVSNPDDPVLGHEYPIHCYPDFVHADGNRLYLGTYTDEQEAEFTVLDISDPVAPVEWTPFRISGIARDLAVYGEYLFIPTIGSLLVL